MATLDTHLRSTSGLRLQTDGTCNFMFEHQRFVIETTEETGDFLLYASFGSLQELQHKNKPRTLLRLLASWNEELKSRSPNLEGQDNSGLLRIDSSQNAEEGGPHVAFIYYGHMDEIEDAKHFQEVLDEFVDDALDFSEKLCELKGGEGVIEKQADPSPPRPPRDSSDGRSKFNRDANGSSSKLDLGLGPAQKESATLADNNITDNSNPKKTSVFSKMISSLKSKTNDIGSFAFIDPNNPECAFVVDKNAAEEGNIKPTINLSRKGEEKKPEDAISAMKGGSFYNRIGDNSKHGDPYAKKGRSFHVGDDHNTDGNKANTPPRRPHRKSTSFTFDDYRAPIKSRRESTSFSIDEHRYPGQSTSFHMDSDAGRSSRRTKSSSSFHIEDTRGPGASNLRPSNIKSKSFHHTDRTRSSYLSDETDDYERSNKSIDMCDIQAPTGSGVGGSTRFNQSEPAVSRRGYPEPPPRLQSRRHSSMASQRSSRSKSSRRTSTKNGDNHYSHSTAKRHSVHNDESVARSTSNRSDRGRHRSKSRPRQPPPPPPF